MGAMRYQPQRPVRLDRSNPLGARVIESIPLNGQLKTVVSGRQIFVGPGGAMRGGPRGMSLRGAGNGGRASVPVDLSKFSVITLAMTLTWDAYANDDALAMEFTANNNSNAGGFFLDPNESGGRWAVSANGNGSATVKGVSFTRPDAGTHRYAIAIDIRNQAVSVYVDGVAVGTTQYGFSGSAGTTFANSTLYLLSRANSALFATGGLQDITLYDGALSPAEAMQDYANPWQIYDDGTDDEIVARAAGDTSLVGAAAAVASAGGTLSTSIRLAGTGTAIAAAAGALATAIRLAGVAQAQAGASGALSTAVQLAGIAGASAAGAGSLATSIALAGIASATAGAAGALAGANAGAALSGTATANASGTAVLVSQISLAGGAFAQASAAGSPATRIQLVGAAATGALSTGGHRPVGVDAADVSPARTVAFAGGTRVARFDGGTHAVKFAGGTRVVKFGGTGSKIVRF